MENPMTGKTTSEKILIMLAARKITKKELSKLLDVTHLTINNRLESNRWTVEDIASLAKIFKVKPADLL